MKKILNILFLLVMSGVALQAQDSKLRVAVFDPSSSGTSIDEGTKIAVREIISSTFVNTGKYTIVERSMLQQIMKEQRFSNTDAVDDSQATELGRLLGANKVVLSVVTLVGGRNMLSVKIIDVKTATVDQQQTKVVSSSELLDVVELLTLELLGEKSRTGNIIASSGTVAVQSNNSSSNTELTRITPSESKNGEPEFIGDVTAVNEDGKTLGVLEKHTVKLHTNSMGIVAFGVFGKATTKLKIDGCCARTVLNGNNDVWFIIRVADNNIDAYSVISIFELEQKKKEREAKLSSAKMFGSKTDKLDYVDFTAKKHGDNSYLIRLRQPVEGQYGIIVSNPYDKDDKKIVVSAFAIEKSNQSVLKNRKKK